MLQGAFFIVAASSPAQRQVILTAINYRAFIIVGDSLTAYSNTSQSLGSVCSLLVRWGPVSNH